ncbi:hypothetical protein [Sutcliffiella rhizosphaerae]|uniref:Membrane or secreted protein n=1 Tax=Sutcliffiella rhizosphaerae TaxID=2880967 RepID=A0ABN8A6M9_9BACI|nr:hypothetical protein [Sutcliffiella rhizosphaerae]CAG9620684.1 hypothetical protein BACCIP111883_01453 [Sutcliffiella rhizosphaerae]
MFWLFLIAFTSLVAIFFYFLNLSLKKHHDVYGDSLARTVMCASCGGQSIGGNANVYEQCKLNG